MAPGEGDNAKPDFQQLLTGCDLMIWLDRGSETGSPTLEARVLAAFKDPSSVERFGGWSLGESAHLINDAWLITGPPSEAWSVFVVEPNGRMTLPVWVDHVGMKRTHYVAGTMRLLERAPLANELPVIG